jgi:hypothetical protein
MVAPTLLAAAKDMVPLPWPSGSFPRTVTANPIVPITAMIADIAAGKNRSDGLFLLVDNLVPAIVRV